MTLRPHESGATLSLPVLACVEGSDVGQCRGHRAAREESAKLPSVQKLRQLPNVPKCEIETGYGCILTVNRL